MWKSSLSMEKVTLWFFLVENKTKTFYNIDKWWKCDSILQRNVTIIYRKRHNFLSHHPQVISFPHLLYTLCDTIHWEFYLLKFTHLICNLIFFNDYREISRTTMVDTRLSDLWCNDTLLSYKIWKYESNYDKYVEWNVN